VVIRYCNQCTFHEGRYDEKEEKSYCSKENCWSEFSKCLSRHAMKRFLEEENASELKSVSEE
jgi:hypothetical protein